MRAPSPSEGPLLVAKRGGLGPYRHMGDRRRRPGAALHRGRDDPLFPRQRRLPLGSLGRASTSGVSYPADASYLALVNRNPTSVNTTQAFLATTDLFGGLSSQALEDVADRVTRVHLSGGSTLFREGEDGDAVYVVMSGRVQVVSATSDGREEVIREMGRGENFGELALLTDDPRAATVRALRDTELLALGRPAFEELLASEPATALSLTRILARWLREDGSAFAGRGRVAAVAVVPGSSSVDHVAFGRALARSLAEHGSVLVVDPELLEARLGPEALEDEGERDAGRRRTTEWLDRQEMEHRFLVYVADVGSTPWSRRCLRQADVALVVAGASDEPVALPGATARAPRPGVTPRSELVLLHPSAVEAPTDTRRWLDGASHSDHHHVRLEDDGFRRDDLGRLARHLAGRAVGFVLGGGGARGFAHVGVIRALREAGVPVDRLGGASMGALVAGLFATGMDAKQVEERLQWAWSRVGHRPHRTLTFPAYSLVTGDRVRRMLSWAFEDRCLEDLWIPFFCTTANLTRGEIVVHRRGPLVRWIEASVSIPGIVPPAVSDEGELLVDGALLNNLPADVMAGEVRGPVVAVSVSSQTELRVDPTRRRAPSGWEAVWGRLLPFREGPSFPSIFRILHRSAVIGSVQSEREVQSGVDAFFQPPLGDFDMFDWAELERIVEVGYRYAARRLDAEPDLMEGLLGGDGVEQRTGNDPSKSRP